MDTLLQAWSAVVQVLDTFAPFFILAGVVFVGGGALYIVALYVAYKQAFFWKHKDRSLDDASKYLMFASLPFYLGLVVVLGLIWFLPRWVGIEALLPEISSYQAIASIAVWFVAQMYWWGWVVERIRKPPD